MLLLTWSVLTLDLRKSQTLFMEKHGGTKHHTYTNLERVVNTNAIGATKHILQNSHLVHTGIVQTSICANLKL